MTTPCRAALSCRDQRFMRNVSVPLRRAAVALAVIAVVVGCEYDGYAYYLTVRDLKPLFITIVDQSGSMNEYQAGIRALIEDSHDRFLSETYGGDETFMREHYFVVPWPSGETWPEAFSSQPSTLMLDSPSNIIFANEQVLSMTAEEYSAFTEKLDDYPVRIYLFYGNGTAPRSDRAVLNTYISDHYPELSLTRSVVVGVPGSDTSFVNGANAIMTGEETVVADTPRMSDYGWSFREYDPNSVSVDDFVDGIIQTISPSPQ